MDNGVCETSSDRYHGGVAATLELDEALAGMDKNTRPKIYK